MTYTRMEKLNRRTRIVQAIAQGKHLKVIADNEGVSLKYVRMIRLEFERALAQAQRG